MISLPVGDTRVTLEARDPAGNIGRDSITITRRPDTKPPAVSSTTPANASSSVPTNASLTVTFSEPIDVASVTQTTFQLRDAVGNLIPGTVTAAGRTAAFDPGPSLAGLSQYTATISAVKDLSGNSMATAHDWVFTTAQAPDVTPPEVTAVSPAAGSSCASLETPVTATFDESINGSTIIGSRFTLRDAGQNIVSASLMSQSARSFSLEPLNSLAFATTYTATLAAGIRDLAGNATPSSFSWSFTTALLGIGIWQSISANASAPGGEGQSVVWTGSEIIVWGGLHGNAHLGTGARYRLATDTWTPMSNVGAPSPRQLHMAAWTGTEMIIWGGCGSLCPGGGAIYNPASDSWRPMSTLGAVNGRNALTAVWTGTELITIDRFGSGRYNPSSDSWSGMTMPPNPLASAELAAVWTGDRMIIWGMDSSGCSSCSGAGAIYDPLADTWSPISNTNAPGPRFGQSIVWTGAEMLVWGGRPTDLSIPGAANTGAAYNPQTNTWRPLSTLCAPSGRRSHSAVWDGNEMLIWGGQVGTQLIPVASGGRYNPLTDSWQQMTIAGAPSPRARHRAVWAGTAMVIWGEGPSGGRYQP